MVRIAAAVLYSAGTERDQTLTNESPLRVWVSPATMDSADYVVLPTITGRTLFILGGAFDATTGDLVTATLSTATVTLDAAGGTTDHVYVLAYGYY